MGNQKSSYEISVLLVAKAYSFTNQPNEKAIESVGGV